jgi:hypothetical protein
MKAILGYGQASAIKVALTKRKRKQFWLFCRILASFENFGERGLNNQARFFLSEPEFLSKPELAEIAGLQNFLRGVDQN